MLYRKSTPQDYPMKYDGKKTEYSIKVLQNIMRKFNLPNEFLD